MTREVGFGKPQPPDTPRRRGAWRRIVLPSVVLAIMGGVGLTIALRSLQDGQMMGFVIGTIWCVALVTVGISKLIKAALGIKDRKGAGAAHEWTLDGKE